jgi:dUTP pyrophosphatase
VNTRQSASLHIHIMRLRKDAVMPSYAHATDAGMDVYASEDVLLLPGETKLVPTALALAIPEGYEAQIRPRSGISLHTMLRIPNSPGTIDAGYRDELCIIMHNASYLLPASSTNAGLNLDEKMNRHGTYSVRSGDKIAQIIFAKVAHAVLTEVDSLDGIGMNRLGGFGSTGK